MSTNKIKDQFTDLNISRQRKYQLRRAADGKCIRCGNSAKEGQMCKKCTLKARARNRKAQGNKPWRKGGFGRRPLYQPSQKAA